MWFTCYPGISIARSGLDEWTKSLRVVRSTRSEPEIY